MGGIIVDQWWGKYKTMLIGVFVYIIGIGMLASASIPSPEISTTGHLVAFIVSLLVISSGSAGTTLPFCAERRNQADSFPFDG